MDLALAPYFDLSASRYSQVSALALILWDYFVTLDQEISYFWNASLSWPTILFFINRYFTIALISTGTIALVSQQVNETVLLFCTIYVRYLFTGGGMIHIFVIQFILAFRLWAMYGNARYLLWVLGILWIITAISASAIVHLSFKHATVTSEPLPGIRACSVMNRPEKIWAYVIPILVFETTLFAMASFKAIRYFIFAAKANIPIKFQIIHVLFRDSLVYYFIILAFYGANALLWGLAPVALVNTVYCLSLAMTSIAASRMAFNLKAQGQRRTLDIGTLKEQNGSHNKTVSAFVVLQETMTDRTFVSV
ncbi:hypothetical protein DL96DRAFT_1628662 [Flagelloscypha sp. PMI_526]|nr:hypothetical protein DL96DRAFT_1628662 [Flagelloscypha sp. PMI_526]